MSKTFYSFILFAFFSVSSVAQKKDSFCGKLVYSITICDTSLANYIPVKYMTIYTNDTLLRIENETEQLGKQIIIKHFIFNKSYLLLQTPVSKYAIQTDHNIEKTDSFPYQFKKKWGKTIICGMKAAKLMVFNKNFDKKLEFLYLKKTNVKYINSFENFPGLPVKYYIPTDFGLLKYELISMEKFLPERDLFGIPSDYKRVSFDQFLDEILQTRNMQEEKH